MNTKVLSAFRKHIHENHLCNKGEKILLAVSGGADSMMMADLFIKEGFSTGIAHCNFQLRGEDSDRDELLVKNFSLKNNIPFYQIRFETETFALEEKLSIEEAARILRYEWFEKIRAHNQYLFIATAHHLNDNNETLLFNFFRGTGIHGLHGIPVKQGKIIRPMLFLIKQEIRDYVIQNEIPYAEDITNLSDNYTRNFLRNTIIPQLEKYFPGLEKRLSQNIKRFAEAEQLYNESVDRYRRYLIEEKENEFFIPVLKLKKCIPLDTIAYEIFKQWNFSYEQSQQIIQLIDREPGKTIASQTHRLIRDRKWFIISPLSEKNISHLLIEKGQSIAETAGIVFHLSLHPADGFILSTNENTASLDASKVTFPLLLRPWKQGDYFYPLGLGKKKKLSRFFIDKKIPLHEKEKIWVLESEKRIIWVVGMRIDDRFKITDKTKEVLRIICKKI
jgi:tRNA(Ile)-lysidine synthase